MKTHPNRTTMATSKEEIYHQQDQPMVRPKNQSQYHADMNRAMVELVPELDSQWATAPMAYSRWRRPDETLDNGDPCFIPYEPADRKQEVPRKQDYIYMKKRKDLEAGYYHLRTQEAYVEVFYRLRKNAPPLCSCCRRKDHPNISRKEYRKVKELIYNRVLAEEPNDVWAAQMRMVHITSIGGQAKAFGKSMYLPALTSSILIGLAGGN